MPGASVTLVIDAVSQQATPDGTRACVTALVASRERDTRLPNNHATACTAITRKFVPVTG
jgi:hypothetical protein